MRRFLVAVAMAGATTGGVALAQQAPSGAGIEPSPVPVVAPPPEALPPPAAPPPAQPANKAGVEAKAGAGLLSFPGAAHDFLNPGFTYGAGISVEAPQAVGLEVTYQGAAYNTKAALNGVVEGVAENGGQALLKLGPKFRGFEPYALGGYSLSFINVAERTLGNGAVIDDWVSKVPVGLGFDFKVPTPASSAKLLLGARSQYDFVFNNSAYQGLIGDTESNASRAGDQINTQITVGGKF